ncbi:unnamed protein product [Closterium sp. NIES-53]
MTRMVRFPVRMVLSIRFPTPVPHPVPHPVPPGLPGWSDSPSGWSCRSGSRPRYPTRFPTRSHPDDPDGPIPPPDGPVDPVPDPGTPPGRFGTPPG